MSKSPTPLFQGIYTALVCPFEDPGKHAAQHFVNPSLDVAAFDRLFLRQMKAGVSGVVINGTTGESPTLTRQEKQDLLRRALWLRSKHHRGRSTFQIIAGVGSNSTQETLEAVRDASQLDVDGLLVVTPYYNKPSASGLEAHFSAAARATNKPVILYNVPGRTVVSLKPDTVARLSQIKNIVGIKEASGQLPLLSAMKKALREALPPGRYAQFAFLSGDDPSLLAFKGLGGHGAISVLSNLFPKTTQELWNDFDVSTFEDLFELTESLFVEANPIPTKALLQRMGFCSSALRLPLTALQNKYEDALFPLLKRVKKVTHPSEWKVN